MSRFLQRAGRYFLVFEVIVDYAFKILRQKIFGGAKPFISPKDLRGILEELGGSFLKFGQLASVRPDYFPEEYCRELLGLLDDVSPIEPQLLDGIFIKEYGKRPEEVFSKFERKPLSAASFGQVHAAWLAEGEPASPDASQGRKVALKVQRPFVAEDFSMDARFFSFLAWVIGKTGIVKTVDPQKVVRDFIHLTEREMDYLKEAENLTRLREQVARGKLRIKIPKAHLEYTTRRILVMEFIEGQTLKSFYLSNTPPPDASSFFREAIFFELYSFLFEGFFHADPHPANILVLDGGGLGLVDAGIAAEIKISDRKKFARYIKAVAKEDLEAGVKAFLEMVRTPLLEILSEAKTTYPQYWIRIQFMKNIFLKRIKEELDDLMTRWHRASRDGGPIHEKSPMHKFMELFQLAERSGIRMPEAGVLFARTFLSLDVSILALAPTFNIPLAVQEFFEKYPEEFRRLEELPDEEPPYLEPGFDPEWAEIFSSFDLEQKGLERELLAERTSAIMETFE
ncbi:hypothetical protein A2757_02645 [Candidatus Giovannonibacteria bacterium RIFCSPHIGHO2_01_FULL_48_47]|nr:MAG: hypothetical protein A2757_02645 [Candidatus Giovannonibacteria bacterium RIFCSPHIGHO2_01_FULL_48_47]OGF69063.1 MAG: hypothetical protein A3D61_03440 [Candidatus Giovannonibacteria bacterium RIFCSPHIGHO2_02_FULL_48_15]OGF87959.1 MAG: hypothetical protein A3B26_03645 [Candidatus Giovannonibacteria bacterium RIFCSPLOWO2_01_FULL_48_47]OGF95831.1 MAG: hypothetical protein A2613_03345 [Candidatus Giovannonibacteria bacterium RIFOXYD1_FULL_48_21]HBT81617.1 hypothetical protein [Candidatus Gio